MYLLLVNTKAGNNRYQHIERSFKRILDQNKIRYKIVIINDLSDIANLLHKNIKDNTKAIVAVGGNGTVTSIIDAIAGLNLPLGIIPTSRSNQLATMLGIKNWQIGVKLLAKHQISEKRLGKIGQRYFVGSLSIIPRRNLLTDILNKQNWFKRFLGVNLSRNVNKTHDVATYLKLDNNLEVKCQVSNINLYLEDAFEKKMKIVINTSNKKHTEQSIFRTNKLEITSSLNLPILSGNEILANTPAIIQATGKTIAMIQPCRSEIKKTSI